MQGFHEVKLLSELINWQFTVRRKITIIRGNSGTGKTTFVDYLNLSFEEPENYTLSCDVSCIVVTAANWQIILKNLSGHIVFIDESRAIMQNPEFKKEIQKSDNYFVLFNRDNIRGISYSMYEIYEMYTRNGWNLLRPIYQPEKKSFEPTFVITEDSKAGHAFFLTLAKVL